MSVERNLINKVISSKNLDVVIGRGIETQHFFNKKNQEVWDYVVGYNTKYGEPPPMEKVRAKYKDYEYGIVTEPLEAVMDDFVADYSRKLSSEFLRDMLHNFNSYDPTQLPSKFYDMAQTMEKAIPHPSVAKFSDMKDRIEEYKKEIKDGGIQGIKTGIPTIDELTTGFHPGDYITVSAFLGVGKSQYGMYLMFQAYLQDKKAMLITLEMSKKAVFRRFDAYLTNIKYHALKKLELGEGDLKKWEEIAAKAEEAKGKRDIIVIDDMYNATVDKVHAAIKRHNPDICCVDYVSLMSVPNTVDTSNSYRRVQVITQGLKQVARREHIPIIGIAQLNRDAGKGIVELTSMADSIAIAQDSDIVMALNQDEEMHKNKVMQVKLLKSRDSGRTDVHVDWDLENGVIKERSGKHYEAKNQLTDDPDNPFQIRD